MYLIIGSAIERISISLLRTSNTVVHTNPINPVIAFPDHYVLDINFTGEGDVHVIRFVSIEIKRKYNKGIMNNM